MVCWVLGVAATQPDRPVAKERSTPGDRPRRKEPHMTLKQALAELGQEEPRGRKNPGVRRCMGRSHQIPRTSGTRRPMILREPRLPRPAPADRPRSCADGDPLDRKTPALPRVRRGRASLISQSPSRCGYRAARSALEPGHPRWRTVAPLPSTLLLCSEHPRTRSTPVVLARDQPGEGHEAGPPSTSANRIDGWRSRPMMSTSALPDQGRRAS